MRLGGVSLAETLAYITAFYPGFWLVLGGVLGAVFGSFLNCARYRLPRGISLRHPPSHCPACKTTLGVPDLVPVFSWLALRGRCRHCGAPIGIRSLWLELASTGAGVLAAWVLLRLAA